MYIDHDMCDQVGHDQTSLSFKGVEVVQKPERESVTLQ